MKLLIGTVVLGAAVSAFGQEVAAPRAVAGVRVATDVMISGAMKQSPFTADESGETVRVMADGNRIVESWSGKMARNSEGRIRRDITAGKVGDGFSRPFIFGGATASGGAITLGSLSEVNRVYLAKADAENGVARFTPAPAAEGVSGQGSVTIVRSGTPLPATDGRTLTIARTDAAGEGVVLTPRAEGVRVALAQPAEEGKFTTRKENLGMRDFSGVSAEGVRVITTFLPGAVGNEREIEVSSETWFSKDLGVVVYSKRTDPRTGETTYQLSNVNRVEPDPSLFAPKK